MTRNYSVSYVEGTLIVKPRPITITAKGAEKVYDDTPLVNELYEVQQEGKDCGLLAKHGISELRTNGTITNKGETPNTFESENARITRKVGGQDVTKNYKITYVKENLVITPRPIKITTGSSSKVYDGTELKNGTLEVESESKGRGLLSAHNINELHTNGTITNVGSVRNTFYEKPIIKRTVGGEDVTENYEFDYSELGLLQITKRPIWVRANSASKPFDGTPLSDSGFTYEEYDKANDRGLLQGHKIAAIINGEITKVGTVPNVISSVTITDRESGENVTENYDITTFNGTLTVEAQQLTITTLSAWKYYDGNTLVKTSILTTPTRLQSDTKLSESKYTARKRQ